MHCRDRSCEFRALTLFELSLVAVASRRISRRWFGSFRIFFAIVAGRTANLAFEGSYPRVSVTKRRTCLVMQICVTRVSYVRSWVIYPRFIVSDIAPSGSNVVRTCSESADTLVASFASSLSLRRGTTEAERRDTSGKCACITFCRISYNYKYNG